MATPRCPSRSLVLHLILRAEMKVARVRGFKSQWFHRRALHVAICACEQSTISLHNKRQVDHSPPPHFMHTPTNPPTWLKSRAAAHRTGRAQLVEGGENTQCLLHRGVVAYKRLHGSRIEPHTLHQEIQQGSRCTPPMRHSPQILQGYGSAQVQIYAHHGGKNQYTNYH